MAAIDDAMRGNAHAYTYDGLHRLVSETCPGGADNMALAYGAPSPICFDKRPPRD